MGEMRKIISQEVVGEHHLPFSHIGGTISYSVHYGCGGTLAHGSSLLYVSPTYNNLVLCFGGWEWSLTVNQ